MLRLPPSDVVTVGDADEAALLRVCLNMKNQVVLLVVHFHPRLFEIGIPMVKAMSQVQRIAW